MGGAETWLMEVLRLWAKTGVASMDFLLTSGNRGIFDDEAQRLGAKLHYVQFSKRRLPGFARAFRRILRERKYAAIHDHSDYASGWHYLLGSGLLPAIRVTHVHNPAYSITSFREVSVQRKISGYLGRVFVAHLATNIAATSHQVIGEYGFDRPVFSRIPTRVLHCGFDPDRFTLDRGPARASVRREFDWPHSCQIVLFAGRIDQSPDAGHPQNHKNSGFAVSIAIECARRDDNVRALFAGNPSPATTVLEQRIAAAGLAGRIRLIGVRTDIEKLMVGSDALLFPSRGEGLGMVAVEAQAAGLPVLASTAVPRECVVVPELVQFRDLRLPVSTWSDALLGLCRQPRDVADANARVAASDFAIRHSAQTLLNLYGSVCA
jgi:glycosyltransferase involved in cell wall biosynthesis